MTALDDAAKAVTEARVALVRRLYPWSLDPEQADETTDALIAAVRLHDTELVRAEAVTDNTGTAEDEAYNQAIGDAANAIAAHNPEEQA